jgi:hypothetical protein
MGDKRDISMNGVMAQVFALKVSHSAVLQLDRDATVQFYRFAGQPAYGWLATGWRFVFAVRRSSSFARLT